MAEELKTSRRGVLAAMAAFVPGSRWLGSVADRLKQPKFPKQPAMTGSLEIAINGDDVKIHLADFPNVVIGGWFNELSPLYCDVTHVYLRGRTPVDEYRLRVDKLPIKCLMGVSTVSPISGDAPSEIVLQGALVRRTIMVPAEKDHRPYVLEETACVCSLMPSIDSWDVEIVDA